MKAQLVRLAKGTATAQQKKGRSEENNARARRLRPGAIASRKILSTLGHV
jgi:hypothetical protein